MGEFASKGVAGAGLGTGIAGLSLGVLNTIGGLGGLLGNRIGCGYGMGPMGYPVDLYQSQLMAQKDAEIARLNAKVYSDESDLAIYKYFEGKISALEAEIANNKLEQCKFNSTVTATLGTIGGQIASLQNLMASITKTAVPQSAVCDFNSCCTCANG